MEWHGNRILSCLYRIKTNHPKATKTELLLAAEKCCAVFQKDSLGVQLLNLLVGLNPHPLSAESLALPKDFNVFILLQALANP